MKRKSLSGKLLISAAVIVVAALIAATIALSIPPDDGAIGGINGAAFSYDGPVRYSLEAENEFKGHMSSFLEKALTAVVLTFVSDPSYDYDVDGPIIYINDSSSVSEPFISLYANAGIPAEKLMGLGQTLADAPFDAIMSGWQNILLFFIELKESPDGEGSATAMYCPACDRLLRREEISDGKCAECGAEVVEKNYDIYYASAGTMTERLAEIDFAAAYADFVSSTMLTEEESARLIYELIYISQDAAGREVMDALGRTRFQNIVVSAGALVEGLTSFSSSGASLIEARAMAALAYELGAVLKNVTDEVGAETILRTFRLVGTELSGELKEMLESEGVSAEELADIDELNNILKATDNVAGFALTALTEALLSTDTPLFDALYYSSAAETDELKSLNRDLFTVLAAKSFSAGLDAGYASGLLSDSAAAADAFAVVFERMALLDDTAGECVTAEELKRLFDGAREIAERFASVTDTDGISSLSSGDRALIAEYAAFAGELYASGKLSIGADAFVYGVISNAVYELIDDAIANIDYSGN